MQDEKGSQIFIRGAFTPEDVIDPQTVKLSISYAELNVNQARELRFDAYIFDKVTNSFLNTEPYPKPFRYDPSAD